MSHRIIKTGLSAPLLAILAILGAAASASADSRIAWSSFGPAKGQIVSAKPDGSQMQKVSRRFEFRPDWGWTP